MRRHVSRPSLSRRRIMHADDTNGSSMDRQSRSRHPLWRSQANGMGSPAP
ncbi:hypothetical protein MID00_16400 [Alcaligenes sp. NLF5-7]|nr:hypothetical protein [Alcaligenes sp. NLF5-7]UTM01058.1 hypothetical protein MID00_16400 [Alcaligenes sp. NLF5-7]